MKRLFTDPKFALLWTIIRIWLGVQWLEAGLSKMGNPAWTGDKAGTAVTGFLSNAVKLAGGEHPAVQSWYASFLQNFALPNAKIFSYLVSFGEVAVGIGLILGCLTTFALIGGALLNLNFMLSGATSTNPILYTAALILLVAGINASRIGLDYFIFKKKIKKQTGFSVNKISMLK
ncbi:DoxX family membrane protein [Candidatus Formimonas warabiya]|uniref:Crp/Fnr family transcriptional regulator n=1 Tax=Formimonas warabiya TaxID=1761012 RepID=A0A3G1KP96_FORW1|nr:DoxX family membrane protein [Candidatus Formimonas warabiya]ATW24293.1 Crp/Fnr family transcriptional regulator [Candidatus Formimonas warabiya]